MKKFIYILLGAVALASCSKSMEQYVDTDKESVTFCVSDIARASSSVTDKTTWTAGEQVLIWQSDGYASTTATGVYEIASAVDGAASLTWVSGREFAIVPSLKETFHAIYPYTEDMIVTGEGVCLGTDHLANDVIYATATSDGTIASVAFNFDHLLAKLEFIFDNQSNELTFDYPLTAKLYNINTGVTGLGSTEEEYSYWGYDDFKLDPTSGIDVVFDLNEDGMTVDNPVIYVFVDPNEEIYPSLYVVSATEDDQKIIIDKKFDFDAPIDGQGKSTTYTAKLTDLE